MNKKASSASWPYTTQGRSLVLGEGPVARMRYMSRTKEITDCTAESAGCSEETWGSRKLTYNGDIIAKLAGSTAARVGECGMIGCGDSKNDD